MNSTILNQIFILFGLIGVGYVINKAGVLDALANKRLSSFLLKVALPATILNSALTQETLSRGSVLSITLVAAAVFVVVPLMSKGLAKVLKLDNTYQLMLNYSNLGFMGFPIIASVYGDDIVFYAAIFMMVFNVHIFTFGILTLQGKGSEGGVKALLKKLCTPGILSALLAFALVLFPGAAVPSPVCSLIASVGSVTTPLAMIVIGSQLAEVSLLESLKNRSLYLMAAIKLAAYPAVVFLLFSLVVPDPTMVQVAAILTGLPVAGNVTMLCSEYDGDVALAAEGTCVSTLLSLATIPVLLMLIHG